MPSGLRISKHSTGDGLAGRTLVSPREITSEPPQVTFRFVFWVFLPGEGGVNQCHAHSYANGNMFASNQNGTHFAGPNLKAFIGFSGQSAEEQR